MNSNMISFCCVGCCVYLLRPLWPHNNNHPTRWHAEEYTSPEHSVSYQTYTHHWPLLCVMLVEYLGCHLFTVCGVLAIAVLVSVPNTWTVQGNTYAVVFKNTETQSARQPEGDLSLLHLIQSHILYHRTANLLYCSDVSWNRGDLPNLL